MSGFKKKSSRLQNVRDLLVAAGIRIFAAFSNRPFNVLELTVLVRPKVQKKVFGNFFGLYEQHVA